jgi:uncharacterized protein
MTKQRTQLSNAQARRIAIAAQYLDQPRPVAPGRREIRRAIARLGLLQIDSVNVLARAHYMPLFSRLGAYDTTVLEQDAWGRSGRRLFEYWAHEASLVPMELHHLFRWRMEAAARGEHIYGQLTKFATERASFVTDILAQIRDRGGLAASELTGGREGQGGWWGWSESKHALEWLFWTGQLTTARRETAGFTRIYDLPERVLPPTVLGVPTPDKAQAQRGLLRHAARALGIATETDLRDYFRLPVADCKARIAELAEAGELLPVTVEGWRQQAWLDPAARLPRGVACCALLSPFDPLVWERDRTERLFDFHYRLEIYTPAPKRIYGYYCLPFLLGDRIAGRLDLKADRANRTLRVEAAHAEAHAKASDVADALAGELSRLAGWLKLESIAVAQQGGLAKALSAAVKPRRMAVASATG